MKASEDIKLITVKVLTKDLKRFVNKHADDDVACYSSDGDIYYIETLDMDDDGDLWIGVTDDEYDGGFYTVDMLLAELEDYDASTRVYLGCFGDCFTLEVDDKGHVFAYDDENEVVACDCDAFEPDDNSGHIHERRRESYVPAENESRQQKEEARNEKIKSKIETIVLAILTLLVAGGLVYNVYALFTGEGAIWEHVLWGIACLVVTVIGSLTLYYSED